ncbi:hypothetical protein FQB35_01855 [Crassaminicella thermophila]|uniref:Peptidase MA superfamily protein n=1 Tax=Crassaminicella thermophila TaxID=2599308 RepID=A0A5C0SAL6_CRATE|nr:hypothetical protein [Crassaminicella thermophila]QEK11211.1 hypothetical protein FQB35_01855 [Crassaminicella thermophila]
MKKYLFMALLILLLCIGCVDKRIHEEVEAFIGKQEQYVNEKNIIKYMDTISKEKPEYLAEKKSWIRDIQMNDINDYNLKIEDIEIFSKDEVRLKLKQSYFYEGKKYSVKIPLLLKKENGHWKDNDLIFDEISTTHFRIKYGEGLRKYAQAVANVCEIAYQNIWHRYGEKIKDTTIIKIYEDEEILRQSVKLSFKWQFAGWYEYPESIKTTKFEEETYRKILEHELVHKLTISKSNNNMPYWFTEGLAVYFANFPNEPKEHRKKSYYLNRYKDKRMDILKLEKANLEKMKDPKEISNYYDSAGMIVKFMIQKYGLQKVKDIVEALGEFPYQEGTGIEVDKESIKRFHKVFKKEFGISVNDLNEEWISYLNETE